MIENIFMAINKHKAFHVGRGFRLSDIPPFRIDHSLATQIYSTGCYECNVFANPPRVGDAFSFNGVMVVVVENGENVDTDDLEPINNRLDALGKRVKDIEIKLLAIDEWVKCVNKAVYLGK